MMESVFTPEALRTLISIALFSVASAELVLFIFKYSNNAPFKSYIYCTVAITINVIALLLSMQSHRSFSFDFGKVHLQWIIYVVLISLSLLHLLLAFPRENRRAKNSLSQIPSGKPLTICKWVFALQIPLTALYLLIRKCRGLHGSSSVFVHR